MTVSTVMTESFTDPKRKLCDVDRNKRHAAPSAGTPDWEQHFRLTFD